MKHYDVYGMGNALVDTAYEVSEAFIAEAKLQKGLMTLIDTQERQHLVELLKQHGYEIIQQCGGGSAANTVVAVTQFGGTSYYSCKAASDATGDFFLQELKDLGLDCVLERGRQSGVSGECIAMITPDAERTMNTCLGLSAEFSAADLDETALRHARYLYIEGYLVTSPPSFEAALKAQKIAREAGAVVSVTLSDPSIVENFKSAFDQFAEFGIDLVFCNQDEAMIWTGSESPTEAFKKLQTVCKQVAMTCSEDGAMVYDGDNAFIVPGVPVKPIDTTGAGDIFAGAFLYALSQGQSFEQAATLANKAASKLVAKLGARLDADEVRALK